MSIAACARAPSRWLADVSQRARVSRTAFEINAPRRPQRAEPPAAEGVGVKKIVYTASLSVIPRNLVFHAGLKGDLRLKHMWQYGVCTCVSCRGDK